MNPFDWNSGANAYDLFVKQHASSPFVGTSTTGAAGTPSTPGASSPSTATYFTRATPQPFMTVTSLGNANPYVNQIPLGILSARQKYGYNEPGAVPFVGPTSVDTYASVGGKETKIKTEKVSVEEAAAIYAPVQAGQVDKYEKVRNYYSGMELGTSRADSASGDALQAGYASLWKKKYSAGTWWSK